MQAFSANSAQAVAPSYGSALLLPSLRQQSTSHDDDKLHASLQSRKLAARMRREASAQGFACASKGLLTKGFKAYGVPCQSKEASIASPRQAFDTSLDNIVTATFCL